jgi:pimeloyl-ACP methyl ester carboxylesterase
MSQADYTYMLEAGNMVSIEPQYLLMPESSGLDIIQNIEKFCEWLFGNLDEAMRSINRNLELDWDHLSIFGESFGGLLAMILYLQIGRCPLKPSNLRISGIILRCPLSELYKREAGLYCGTFMPTDRAEDTCKEVDEAMKRMPWVELRASTAPPNGMLYAYCSSVCHKFWKNRWGAGSLLEMIEGTVECPDLRTRVWITHGTEDLHVPHGSSSKLVDVLREKWPDLEVSLNLVEGEGHAWDRAYPLTDEHRNLLDTL